MTNNEAEAYALFEGIRLALSIGVQKITICGDSMMVIRVIVHKNIVGVTFTLASYQGSLLS
jgi:ribonuclease HI